MSQPTEHCTFTQPVETRAFPNGRVELVDVGGTQIGRLVLQPGWRWSDDVKPIAGTHSCEAPHFQYHVSGHLAIRMDDGTELVAGPGDVTSLPSGHDAWVVGDEPAVVVDWFAASNYAKAPTTDEADLQDAEAVVTAFGAAWVAHDLERALSMLTDDCVFDATGPAPDGVRHQGRREIAEAWQAIFADQASQFEVEETFAAADRVVQRWCYRWKDGHVRGVDLFRVDGNKIAEKFSYVKG